MTTYLGDMVHVARAPPMRTLKHSLKIDAPPTEVWRVLTTPELVREWACAYRDGLSIRTTWREGETVTWKAPDGSTHASGEVVAFRPGELLKFDYPSDPRGAFSDTFEIVARDDGTCLEVTTGPLDDATLKALERPFEEAAREIKSLAEESAQIHGLR